MNPIARRAAIIAARLGVLPEYRRGVPEIIYDIAHGLDYYWAVFNLPELQHPTE